MFGAILKATNSSFQKGITFCRSIYVKKVMKLLAFIFEQPSYYLILLTYVFIVAGQVSHKHNLGQVASIFVFSKTQTNLHS